MGQIAVILNQMEEVDSFVYGNKIVVYQLDHTKWNKGKEIAIDLLDENHMESMHYLRRSIKDLIEELQDCNILVGTIITGIPYMLFDHAGFMLCETEHLTEELLHIIWKDYEIAKGDKDENEKNQIKENYPSVPFETQCGVYELDMCRLKTSHPEVTSKMALIPFLKKGRFDRLDIYCDHVMPWLERELEMWGMSYQSKRMEKSGYKIEIKHIST